MYSNVYTDFRNSSKVGEEKNLEVRKPAVDIIETQSAIVVLAEMPDINKQNLSVNVKDGILSIKGKRENGKIYGRYLMRETSEVAYERHFELEEDLDTEKISAEYEHGILKVTIGKKEKVKPKVISIN
ncbi:MAG: Hsp20/alpha crystallin family protein [Calditrichia bacterium]